MSLPCRDCGIDTSSTTGIGEYYHVHSRIWNAATLGRPEMSHDHYVADLTDPGFLCLGCLEALLGRRLCADDFSSAPVNDPVLYRKSDRFVDRYFTSSPTTTPKETI